MSLKQNFDRTSYFDETIENLEVVLVDENAEKFSLKNTKVNFVANIVRNHRLAVRSDKIFFFGFWIFLHGRKENNFLMKTSESVLRKSNVSMSVGCDEVSFERRWLKKRISDTAFKQCILLYHFIRLVVFIKMVYLFAEFRVHFMTLWCVKVRSVYERSPWCILY